MLALQLKHDAIYLVSQHEENRPLSAQQYFSDTSAKFENDLPSEHCSDDNRTIVNCFGPKLSLNPFKSATTSIDSLDTNLSSTLLPISILQLTIKVRNTLKLPERVNLIDIIHFLFLFLTLWSLFLAFFIPGIVHYHIPILIRRIFQTSDSFSSHEAQKLTNYWNPTHLSPAWISSVTVNRSHGPIPFLSTIQLDDALLELQLDKNDIISTRGKANESTTCFTGLGNIEIPRIFFCILVDSWSWDTIKKCLETNVNGRQSDQLYVISFRLLGNNLPPIQGINQIQQNLHHILKYEDGPIYTVYNKSNDNDTSSQWKAIIQNKKENTYRCQHGAKFFTSTIPKTYEIDPFRITQVVIVRSMILNRMMDSAAYNDIVLLLDGTGGNYYHGGNHRKEGLEAITEIPLDANLFQLASNTPNYVTNQNRGRNWGIQEAFALGADWVIALDGNVFITREGYSGILEAVVEAEQQHYNYMLLPFYRVADNNLVRNRLFEYVSSKSTLRTLFSKLTKNEAQIAFRKSSRILFPNELDYGYLNKYKLLKELPRNDSFGKDPRYCVEADVGFDKNNLNVNEEVELASRCGYTLRLGYWSDTPRDESALKHPLPRSILRQSSIMVLQQRLADLLGRGIIDEYKNWKVIYILMFIHLCGLFGLASMHAKKIKRMFPILLCQLVAFTKG